MTVVISGDSGIVVSGNTNTLSGITVSRGAGSIATNTAVGASALAANTSGDATVAVGHQALLSNTTGYNQAAVGKNALGANTTGNYSVALGYYALGANTTGSYNTALGNLALYSSTTASNNTAVGYQAVYNNASGSPITAVGQQAAYYQTTGFNVAMGYRALFGNTGATGSYNVSIGDQSLYSNTTGSYNTVVGYQAGYTNSTGEQNTFVGRVAGYNATGTYNTFVGSSAGYQITSGSKNTIIGKYDGNNGGLDIRTSSNYIVLSDGDGNPQIYNDGTTTTFGIGGTSATYTGGLVLNGADANNRSAYVTFKSNGSAICYVGIKRGIQGGSAGGANFLYAGNDPSYGVYLNGSTATSWTSASDERLKENLVEITDAATKVSSLRAVIGNYTLDAEKTRKPFLIAQDVQAVLPEAVTSSVQSKDDPTEYLGVAYTEVIPLLVAAIKELKAEIDQLKGN